MQTKNNYQMEWEWKGLNGIILEKGMGVFNGDTGIICEIKHCALIISFNTFPGPTEGS